LKLAFAFILIAFVHAEQKQDVDNRDAKTQTIISVLQNGDASRRGLAAHSLRGYSSGQAVNALVSGMADSDPLVRAESIDSLMVIISAARKSIESIDLSKSFNLPEAAFLSSEVPRPPIEKFIKALGDMSPLVRKRAFSYLSSSSTSFDALVTALNGMPTIPKRERRPTPLQGSGASQHF
jgi:hypothetical protein